MDAEAKELSGVTRSQNAVHVMPVDWSAADGVLAAIVERIDPSRAETQVLVLTPDAEHATAASDRLVSVAGDRAISVLPATGGPRAARLLRTSPAHIVTGAPAALVQLLQASVLKPGAVRTVVFAWLDSILDTPDAAPLETLLGELPKEGARIILAGEIGPAYEAFIERYARRARRIVEASDDSAAPMNAEYVTTSATARVPMLRRLLDALDLPRADVFARTDAIRAETNHVIRALGYPSDAVRVISGPSESADPLVLVEMPVTRAELKSIAGSAARRIYAIVQPSQLRSFGAMLNGGQLTPVALLDAAERARGRDESLRASVRELLSTGDVRREILALEPLLNEFDGIEIAAAILHLLEQHRPARHKDPVAAVTPMQRLFLNLGERDGVHAPEIVKMISADAGIPGSQIGKVEVRDTHSIVEVATSVAELVVDKISSSAVRGRKVMARLDKPREREERGGRPSGPRGGGDRPDRSGGGGRPARPGAPRGGPRSFDRNAAPSRPPRPKPRRDDA